MKRATLTAYSTNPPAQAADLTDRLLAQEGAQAAPPSGKRRPRARRAAPAAAPSAPAPEAALPEHPPPHSPPDNATPDSPPDESLTAALAAADAASQALRSAARQAPARYDVALRYRLDALAYHLQQVKEFVASFTSTSR
jgi:hypothetical protein